MTDAASCASAPAAAALEPSPPAGEDSEASGSAPITTTPNPSVQRLTKAQKRELKAERQKQLRVLWRQREKEAHRQQVQKRHADREAMLAAMSEDERKTFLEAEAVERQRRYDEVCAQSARLEAALKDGLRVAIDLYYGAQMNEKEQKSLAAQLGRCSGINRRAQIPFSMHLASLKRCPQICLPPTQDHLRWKVHLMDEDVEDR